VGEHATSHRARRGAQACATDPHGHIAAGAHHGVREQAEAWRDRESASYQHDA
jgi:hypothetical protein